MRNWTSAFALALLAPCIPAFATTTTYLLENQAGTSSIGTATINNTTGSITGLNATVNINGTSVIFSGTPSTQGFNINLDEYIGTLTASGDQFQLALPPQPSSSASLIGYTPADNSLCSALAFFCDYTVNLYQGAPSINNAPASTFQGDLVVAPTPEPSSLLLLGSGVLGLVGVVRRRI